MTDYDYDEMFTISVDDIWSDITITNTPTLNVWKLWPEAHLPKYGSEWAACFDLSASLRSGDEVKVYTKNNVKENRQIVDGCAYLASGERMLVPTGLVFDLREWESLRIHPRSGLSLKNGVVIANCEGVVDADYVQQTYVMLHNISTETFTIRDGDRIAQGEVVQVQQYEIVEAEMEPEEKTSRKGGFGSTGI